MRAIEFAVIGHNIETSCDIYRPRGHLHQHLIHFRVGAYVGSQRRRYYVAACTGDVRGTP